MLFVAEQPSQLQLGRPPLQGIPHDRWPQGMHASCVGASQLHDPGRWDFGRFRQSGPTGLSCMTRQRDGGTKWRSAD